jgi:hypothetical protein
MKCYSAIGTIILPDDEQERGLSGFWLTSVTLRIIVREEPVNGTIVESVAEVLPLDEKKEQRHV